MVIMAMDHASIAMNTWEHGTGRGFEGDGAIVRKWNFTTAYVVRTLTHLCGSGFTFLLGMGVVYLGRSRTKLGWSAARLARYFAFRAFVLTTVSTLYGIIFTAGKLWFMNAVLFSLAIDYLLAGLLWLAINKTEVLLAEAIAKIAKRCRAQTVTEDTPGDSDDEANVTQPLLRGRETAPLASGPETVGANLSWHIHNYLLLALSLVTIWWNLWFSANGGSCNAESSAMGVNAPTNPFLRIWFWTIMEEGSHVMSGFPPMAWLSFAIVGILYARVLLAKPWSRHAVVIGQVFAAICFIILFILTRVLQFGNLSDGCLQTPDQARHPDRNPYLASAVSFFYIVKYTPDVAYWAFTLSCNFLLLAGFTALPPRIGQRFTILLDFGTSALFFYVIHLPILFLVGMPLVAWFGKDTGRRSPMDPSGGKGISSLWAYFTFWAGVMLLLWPVCRLYSRFKSKKAADSIWRFF